MSLDTFRPHFWRWIPKSLSEAIVARISLRVTREKI